MTQPAPPSLDRLLTLIDAMADQEVLMLADLVADRFITGTPKRISREAPVLILRYEGETSTPGGGANAVANVAALGGRPIPLGVVGDDASGRELRRQFETLGIPTEGILERAGYGTPTKTRILAGGRHAIRQQVVRFDVEDDLVLTEEERRALLRAASDLGGRAGALVLSDYGYGTVEPGLLPSLRERLPADIPILGDSRYRLGAFAGLSGATPNLEEAETLHAGSLEGPPGVLEQGGASLRQRLGLEFLLITRGSAGMSLFSDRGVAHLPVSGTDQVADVTGAGDTVIGTFALALAAGGTPLEASFLANYAGGVVVMKSGTATLSPDELRSAVRVHAEPLEAMRWAEF